jgi:hypothetical protein
VFGGGRGTKSIAWLAAAVVSVLLAAGPAPAAAPGVEEPQDYGNPAFCAPAEPVADFGLSALPSVHESPAFGDLPFGPKTVSLELSAGPVLAPGESVGFWLHSSNLKGRTPLRWVLRSRIHLVDEAGGPGPVVARDSIRVRTIDAAREVKTFLTPPRAPGFYLYEIEIADFTGKTLAVYDRYLRVERAFWDAKLGLSATELRPGEQLLVRLENLGTEWIEFGEELRLQAHRGGEWTGIGVPGRAGWLLWGGSLMPGRSWSCSAIDLPRSFPPGRYRIVKQVYRQISATNTRTYWLSAPFTVVD